MQKELQAGDKVKYRLFDKKGKEHWFDGLVHGVRRYEDSNGIITNETYLIDTGRDTRVDEYPFDHRDREIDRRYNALLAKGKPHTEALDIVLKHTDLPDSKPDIERVRQPEQIELPAQHVRAV